MKRILDNKNRYLQIAFNGNVEQVFHVLSRIQYDERIIIEAGTPFIKREGLNGIKLIRNLWRGLVVADLKVSDGASYEVDFAQRAGANSVSALGSAPVETLDLFIKDCEDRNLISQIDMLGVDDPLHKLSELKYVPEVVILHKGRDEESNTSKIIEYKQINKIRSKYDVLISAAGGIDQREASSAIFNGSNIVVVNVKSLNDPWEGLLDNSNIQSEVNLYMNEIS